ncbi:MAG: hypothetical protein ACYTHM_14050 [Planctomycetota bacterium]|jgi:hypothetical protein
MEDDKENPKEMKEAPPPSSPRDPEGSGVQVDGPKAALRIGLIALLVLGAGAFGLHQSRFLPKLPGLSSLLSPRRIVRPDLPEGFPVPPEDVPLASDPILINGRKLASARFASARSPETLVAEYAQRLRPLGYTCLPGSGKGKAGKGRFVRFAGKEQVMLGFRDPKGRFMGILAFANAATGGSDYFILRDLEPEGDTVSEAGEIEGREPPGVIRPPLSTREYCIERRGARPSVLALYWSEAPPDKIEYAFRHRMPEHGWTEPPGAREAFVDVPEGTHLFFHRGGDRCLVHVSPSDKGEGSWVTLAYKERSR